MIMSLLLVLGILGAAQGILITCPGTAASDECYCQRTDRNVTCPAGSYCPQYSEEVIAANMAVIVDEGCFVRSDGELQCPCTPGFYCPNNTLSPSYCCESYFCETPHTISICPEGNFCKTGNVAGIRCGSEINCPEGSSVSGNAVMVVLAVFILFALFLAYYLKSFIEAQVREAPLTKEEISEASTMRLTTLTRRTTNVSHDVMRNTSPSLHIGDQDDVIDSGKLLADDMYKIEFEDVGLVLESGLKIMSGVTGEFIPMRTCAIMGPSGAGKTTIINLVTGKAKKTEGIIRVNGEEVEDLSKWKKLVGFVPQEDVMIRKLTVRDNIAFSAGYRLPTSMSFAETQRVVNETLLSLGIDHVQHSYIGDERERGISGGQRKRVNIGIELAALPRVLFLDEPTSGLDSTSSTTLTKQLKSIAVEQKVTIAAVIHQPSMATFQEFDDLLLLGRGGMVVYQGPVCDAVAYFSSIGFKMKTSVNPADFFLDITNGAVDRENDPTFQTEDLFCIWENIINGRPVDFKNNNDENRNSDLNFGSVEESSTVGGKLKHTASVGTLMTVVPGSVKHEETLDLTLHPLKSSKHFCYFMKTFFEFMWRYLVDSCRGVNESMVGAFTRCTEKDEIRITPGFWWQMALCMKRAFKQKYRRFGSFATQMIIHMGVALIVGSVSTELHYVGPLPGVVCATFAPDMYTPCTSPLFDGYINIANFLSLATIFAAISVSTITFGGEQVNYWRESAAGLRTVPYFIVYWWSWSLGYLLSVLVTPDKVFLLGVLAAILFAVSFSGTDPTITEVNNMSPAISWLWSCAGTRWMMEAFYVSQLAYYEFVPSGPLEGEPYMNVAAGLDVNGFKIPNFMRAIRGLWWCGVGYGVLAMMIMSTTHRDKKK